MSRSHFSTRGRRSAWTPGGVYLVNPTTNSVDGNKAYAGAVAGTNLYLGGGDSIVFERIVK
jgi:hypothetical protein